MTISVIVSDLYKEEARLLLDIESVRKAIQALCIKGASQSLNEKDICAHVYDILIIQDQPMRRSDILRELQKRDIIIPGVHPKKNLGTILWRNKHMFCHVTGQGYWKKDCEE